MKHLYNYVCTLLFCVAVLLFFGLAYPHHLHYQEQFQLFLFDGDYVWNIVRLPGGIADLLGRFCTQFFLFAWVGAVIIALLLSVIQLLTLRLLNVPFGQRTAAPNRTQECSMFNVQCSMFNVQCSISYIPSFILWIFLLNENSLLSGVWAVMLTLLASWLFDRLPNGRIRYGLLIVIAPLLYWMTGPVCIVLFLLLAPSPRQSPWYYLVFPLLALLPILSSHYLPVPADSLWFGVHYHRYPSESPTLLWVAALSVVAVVFISRAIHRWKKTRNQSAVIGHLSLVAVSIVMGLLVWKNSDFKAERVMKYDFMACHQQWNRILQTINEEKPYNQIGVTVQNLALAMRGLLADHMFEYRQNGTLGLLPDVQSDATSPLPTAEAFYHLGMTNVAQRTVFEAQEAILDYQKSARSFKRLAQTNIINGSYGVARKYLKMLQKTLFYRDWANETLQLLNDEKAIANHPEYGRLRQYGYKEDFFFADKVRPDMLESLFQSNTDNRLAYDYLMAYYLLTGDLENFANHVGWGEKLGYSSIPRHFQEAMILRWSMNRENNGQVPVQIQPDIAQRFKQFGAYINSPAMTREGLAQNFGDTYWYYYLSTMKQ